jgi:hypothetical protein
MKKVSNIISHKKILQVSFDIKYVGEEISKFNIVVLTNNRLQHIIVDDKFQGC